MVLLVERMQGSPGFLRSMWLARGEQQKAELKAGDVIVGRQIDRKAHAGAGGCIVLPAGEQGAPQKMQSRVLRKISEQDFELPHGPGLVSAKEIQKPGELIVRAKTLRLLGHVPSYLTIFP